MIIFVLTHFLMHGVMTELNFASYVCAIHPALLKHSEKEDAALFLLASVTGQLPEPKEDEKKTNLKKDGSLDRMLRGAVPVPEEIRLATASPEVVKGVTAYFRKEVARDINPHLKADLVDSFRVLIDKDITIPDAKKEQLMALQAGEDLELFLAETFVYAINRFGKLSTADGEQKISIPLLVFTFLFGLAIYACTMFTMVKLGAVSQPLLVFAFFFAIVLFIFLIGFYFFLWRRDI